MKKLMTQELNNLKYKQEQVSVRAHLNASSGVVR